MRKTTDDAEPLKRLGGGRWQTRDGRFTIEPQGGTWSLVDAEQTDELGLALVRGPFRSLTAAKDAIAGARSEDAPESPLADRAAAIQQRSDGAPPRRRTPRPSPPSRAAGVTATPEPEAESKPETASGGPAAAPEIPDGVRMETVYVVEATYSPEAAERRPAARPEHLTHIAELLADGRLVEAGGHLDLSTAILIVRAESEEEALAMFRDDIYVRTGVWTGEFTVKPFGRVVREG